MRDELKKQPVPSPRGEGQDESELKPKMFPVMPEKVRMRANLKF
jgi:hypothetical protein